MKYPPLYQIVLLSALPLLLVAGFLGFQYSPLIQTFPVGVVVTGTFEGAYTTITGPSATIYGGTYREVQATKLPAYCGGSMFCGPFLVRYVTISSSVACTLTNPLMCPKVAYRLVLPYGFQVPAPIQDGVDGVLVFGVLLQPSSWITSQYSPDPGQFSGDLYVELMATGTPLIPSSTSSSTSTSSVTSTVSTTSVTTTSVTPCVSNCVPFTVYLVMYQLAVKTVVVTLFTTTADCKAPPAGELALVNCPEVTQVSQQNVTLSRSVLQNPQSIGLTFMVSPGTYIVDISGVSVSHQALPIAISSTARVDATFRISAEVLSWVSGVEPSSLGFIELDYSSIGGPVVSYDALLFAIAFISTAAGAILILRKT